MKFKLPTDGLVDLMREFGYEKERKCLYRPGAGISFELCGMVNQTYFSNNGMEEFKVCSAEITHIYEQLQNGIPFEKIGLTPNVVTFFEGVKKYQPSEKHLTLSQVLEENGGVTHGFYVLPEIYGYTKLIHYLKLLKEDLYGKLDFPITCILSSGNHNIWISYNINKQSWMFFNGRDLNVKKVTTQAGLANKIMESFLGDEKVIFSINLFIKNAASKQNLIACMEQIKNKLKQADNEDMQNLNFQDLQGFSLLHLAVVDQAQDFVKFLLSKAGILPNLKTQNGETPLTIAIRLGDLETIKLLLKHKDINVDRTTTESTTSLVKLIIDGREEIAKLLIKHKILLTPFVEGNDGKWLHLLDIAAYYGRFDTFVYLLRNEAISTNQIQIEVTLEALFNNCKDNIISTEKINNLLYSAVRFGHLSIVQWIFNRYKDLDVNSQSILYLASAEGDTEMVKFLLDQANIRLNQAMNDGAGPLSIAAYEGHVGVVQLLLDKKGIDPNQAMHKNGETPLHFAVEMNRVDIVRSLLAHEDIQPNKVTKTGITPIDMAVQRNYVDIVRVLLPKLENEEDILKLIKTATAFKYKDIANLLVARLAQKRATPDLSLAFFPKQRKTNDEQNSDMTASNIQLEVEKVISTPHQKT